MRPDHRKAYEGKLPVLHTLRKRLDHNDDGFTLIELMVVVLIIAILMAIAIPSFLGAQTKAKDRAAQSDLRNALTAAKTQATDYSGLYYKAASTNTDAASLQALEPSLQFTATITDAGGLSSGKLGVVVGASGANITLIRKSASGMYYCLSNTNSGVSGYGKSAIADGAGVDTFAECTGGW
jgi:type IV pilus assembly protein PilA